MIKRFVIPIVSLTLIGVGTGWLWHPGAGLLAVGLAVWFDMWLGHLGQPARSTP